MPFRPRPYDDPDTALAMRLDCTKASLRLRPVASPSLVDRVLADPPSIRFEDNAAERPKPVISVDEAALRLAVALDLSVL